MSGGAACDAPIIPACVFACCMCAAVRDAAGTLALRPSLLFRSPYHPRSMIDVLVTTVAEDREAGGKKETKATRERTILFQIEHPKYFLGLFGAEEVHGKFTKWDTTVLNKRRQLDHGVEGFKRNPPREPASMIHLTMNCIEWDIHGPPSGVLTAYTRITRSRSGTTTLFKPGETFTYFSPVLPMRTIAVSEIGADSPLAEFEVQTLRFDGFEIDQSKDGTLSLRTREGSRTSKVTKIEMDGAVVYKENYTIDVRIHGDHDFTSINSEYNINYEWASQLSSISMICQPPDSKTMMKYTISFPEKEVLIEWDDPELDQQPADQLSASQKQRWCVSNSKASLVAYYAISTTYGAIPYPRAVPRVFGRQYWHGLDGLGDKALYVYSWDRPADVTSCWIEEAAFPSFKLSVRDFEGVPDLYFEETKSSGLSGRLKDLYVAGEVVVAAERPLSEGGAEDEPNGRRFVQTFDDGVAE
eukprot:GHVU01223093.1.p1 GENE.GHVU01223093.1~~GHVU01223093.1.p1  ORF type:complete len:471 (-),score=49.72 GHVU01223093.1:1174-2586(-)